MGPNDGEKWTLSGSVCDGTGICEMNFSDALLSDLVGFSAKQGYAYKKGCVNETLSTGMKKCRDAIIDMCQFIKVDFEQMPPLILHICDDSEMGVW